MLLAICETIFVEVFISVRSKWIGAVRGLPNVWHAIAIGIVVGRVTAAVGVFANLPTWLALPRSNFALGEEGAMLMPTARNLDTLVSVHTGQPAQIKAIEHPATRQEMPYYHGIISENPDWAQLASEGARVFTTRYVPDTVFAQPAGSIEYAVEPDVDQSLALFGECLALNSADSIFFAGALEIDLTWQQECEVPAEYTVFVHALDEGGRLLAQADGDPLSGILPFALWPEDVVVHDKRFTTLESQPSRLLVGLYDRYTGERVPAFTAAGEPLADHAIPIPHD